ncbi:unnamed protein product [Echinostoma caproni]|uniref:Ras-GEF domain-containing protein n=1 Tax=Echinostoma caproni TaxID=27848 RepID=A0A183AEY5_9TREM|nr:unnamed protein product [Echinostoma caproni]
MADRNSLRLLLSRWLRQPHVRDFDSISGLAELHRFTSIVVGWYWAFQPNNTSTTPSSEQPGSWTSRYMGISPQVMSGRVSNIMFPNIGKRNRDSMAKKLDSLCRHAEYRAKALQSKYAESDSGPSVGRTSHRRQCSPHYGPRSNQAYSTDRVRKISAPIGNYTEIPSGLTYFNVAEELTLIDKGLFLNLLLPELLNNVRNRPCPTYTATVDQFNRVVNVVQCSILRIGPGSPKDPINGMRQSPVSPDCKAPLAVAVWSNKNVRSPDSGVSTNSAMETFCEAEHKRAQIIAQWIDIAWRLRRLNNLNSLQAVLVALQIGAVRRLRHCWTIVEL